MGVVDVNMAGWRGTYKHVLKLEVVGDARVGKTCLATRFGEYNFLERYHPTMGYNFRETNREVGGNKVMLHVWDINGAEQFRNVVIQENYLSGVAGFVVAYDVTDAESFQHLEMWLDTIKQHGTANVQVVLVANKCDVPKEQWVVSEEDAEKFAEDHSLKLFYTSAKTGGNVEEAFLWLVQMIYDKYKDSK